MLTMEAIHYTDIDGSTNVCLSVRRLPAEDQRAKWRGQHARRVVHHDGHSGDATRSVVVLERNGTCVDWGLDLRALGY